MDASGSAITGRTKFAEPRQLFEDFVRRRVVASCSRFRLFALNKLEKKAHDDAWGGKKRRGGSVIYRFRAICAHLFGQGKKMEGCRFKSLARRSLFIHAQTAKFPLCEPWEPSKY